MTEAPERIWTNYREANRLDVAYDEPPRHTNDDCRDEYISRAAHDAAVSAARKEGMQASAGISLAAAAGYAQGGRRLKGAILARALGMQAAAESIAESIRREANK